MTRKLIPTSDGPQIGDPLERIASALERLTKTPARIPRARSIPPLSETERCLEGIPISPYPFSQMARYPMCLEPGPNGRLCITTGGGMLFIERKHIEGDIAPFCD